jgi:putative aldouronate transport system substrate-binding protein
MAQGDGKGVVAGLGGGIGPSLSPFAGAYGLPMRDFVKTGGGYEYFAVQPGILDALLLFRQMEEGGLIAPESWEGIDAMEGYKTGDYCSAIVNGGGHTGRIQNAFALVDESFQEWMLPAPTAGAGSRGYTQEPMFWGTSQIGNMENNNPIAAARVINYLISEEGYKLTAVGIEGRDHEVVDGEIVLLEQRTKDGFPIEPTDTGAHPLASCVVSWVPQEWQNWQLLYGNDAAFVDWFNQMWENQGMYQIPTYGSLTLTSMWGDFLGTSNDLVNIAFVEVVKAASEEDAKTRFDQFVAEWMAAGGDDAQAEMSEKLVELYGN